MRLTPQERDRLLIAQVAELARRRLARGLRLNLPETIAIVSDTAIEAARDGCRLTEAVERASSVLTPADVLPEVPDLLPEVRVEAVFDDGTRLVVIPEPVGPAQDPLHAPGAVLVPEATHPNHAPPPGAGQDIVAIEVVNTSDVPISVTSHWHFFEANPRLRFDRAAAYGRRLAIDAGGVVRFDPGVPATAYLMPIGGARVAVGFAGLVDGPLDDPAIRAKALRRVAERGYLDADSAGGGRAG
ncbi:urease subunit gamma [Nostocoides sp.]|uniref:urease subunit gamma n=2 Tax=Nostocoides sp. TaxID=1917966 RepID=UPI002CAA2EC7|nr:urease subunit gamma [Tetrasphaera sp.]